ncbi:BglG family transcription antiterminator [Abyssicoccus albus]|uniref:BglG family transcription antiterminator n=1 Tax=Abyssicoccus albus TaxID=1817405 RepID=UPI00097E2864|nr:PRD domain-containing protein [Abyssicoccus albus]AQL55979.1 hypothetical protein BVH56_03100 [Abyssicoccus albus]
MKLTEKHLLIIKYLLKKEMNEERLSHDMRISVRTLSNYIINIQDHFNNSIQINKQYGKLSIQINNEKRFNNLFHEINEYIENQQNAKYKLKGEIFNYLIYHSISNIDDISELFYLSKSTTIKLIQELKEQLNAYNVKIKGKTNVGLIIEGSEFQIRKIMIEEYPIITQNEEISANTEILIQNLITKYQLDYLSSKKIRTALKVTEQRIRNGYIITDAIELDNDIYGSMYYKEFINLKKQWKNKYTLSNVNDELLLIVLQLLGRRATILDKINYNEHVAIIDEIITATVKDIDYFYKIKIDKDLFTDDIRMHLIQMINRLVFDIKLQNNMAERIMKQYPFAFELSKIFANHVQRKLNIEVPYIELSLLTLYFNTYIDEIDRNYKEINDIGIITDQGLSTTNLLKSNLHNIFGNKINVDIYHIDQLTPNLVDKYKFLVSSVKVNQMFNKIIYIEDILDENLLKTKIDKFLIYKDVNNNRFINKSAIVDYLTESDFYILENNMDYQEIISYLCDQLVLEKKVSTNFKDKIFKKEEARSTLNGYVGFPHSEYEGTKIHIKIALNKQNVNTNEPIKLVILIGIPSENLNEIMLVRIYEEILAINSNSFLISKLSLVDEYTDFIKVLNQEMRK